MKDLRFVVAGCVVYRGPETYSTTVTLTADEGLSHFELNRQIREQAAPQMLFCNNAHPDEVIVINQEDITYHNGTPE